MNDLIAFQVTLAGATAQNVPANPVVVGITAVAPSTNSANVVLGNSSSVTASTGFVLTKGGPPVFIPLAGGNTNQLWAIGTTSDTFSIIGS